MKINEIITEGMNRRGFLKGAGAVMAGGTLSGCGPNDKSKQIRRNFYKLQAEMTEKEVNKIMGDARYEDKWSKDYRGQSNKTRTYFDDGWIDIGRLHFGYSYGNFFVQSISYDLEHKKYMV